MTSEQLRNFNATTYATTGRVVAAVAKLLRLDDLGVEFIRRQCTPGERAGPVPNSIGAELLKVAKKKLNVIEWAARPEAKVGRGKPKVAWV